MSALRQHARPTLTWTLQWGVVALLLFGVPPAKERRGPLPAEHEHEHAEHADQGPPNLEHDHDSEGAHDEAPAWASRGGIDSQLAQEREGLVRRLLGPIATVAASVQWVRYDLAVRNNQYLTAYALAQTALSLDPGAGQGWITLAWHLIVDRGALVLEPDEETRRAWIQAGLEMLEDAESQARNRHEVAFARGLAHLHLSEIVGFSGWPASKPDCLRAAADAFERSGDWGHSTGHEAAHDVRAILARLEALETDD